MCVCVCVYHNGCVLCHQIVYLCVSWYVPYTRWVHVHDVTLMIVSIAGHLRPGHSWHPRRHFSTLSSFTNNLTSRRSSPFHNLPSLLQPSRWHVSIVQLEDRANSETDNPQAQARYLEVSLDRGRYMYVCTYIICT